MITIYFTLGLISWTLSEYLLHRFLGHVHKGNNFFKKEHLQHHVKVNYFAPFVKKFIASLLAATVLFLVFNLFTESRFALAFTSGFWLMYMVYEYVHFRYHKHHPFLPIFIHFRKHHFYHHFHNPKVNHGVTTRFWDRVFGTFVETEEVTVPKKMVLPWLGSSDEIFPEYSRHFRIR